MNDDDRKYLDILQSAISRMATNSFQLKGWSVALGSVIVGLTAKDAQPQLAVIALLPVVVFCVLDAYFLGLERGFRDLYERFVAGPAAPNRPALYSMAFDTTKTSTFAALGSRSVWAVHGVVVVIALAVAVWGVSCKNGSACGALSPVPVPVATHG